MQTIEEVLETVGQQLIDDVAASQRSKGLRASGRSAASLHLTVTSEPRLRTLRIFGAAYFFQQQNGRRPSSRKPSRAMVESIREWLVIRGLKIPAYTVAMAIQKRGIRVPNKYNPGGVLSEPLAAQRVRGLLKTGIRSTLITSARSTLFS